MKLLNRYTVAAFIAGAGLMAGLGAVAQATGMAAMHHGMALSADASPADVSAHVDHTLKHLYVEIDATPAQQAQIGPLVQQAVTDLLPLRSQLKAGHTEFVTALTQTTIDRNAWRPRARRNSSSPTRRPSASCNCSGTSAMF